MVNSHEMVFRYSDNPNDDDWNAALEIERGNVSLNRQTYKVTHLVCVVHENDRVCLQHSAKFNWYEMRSM